MGCGKTMQLLQVAFNYEERGHKVCVIKPKTDTKNGTKLLTRIGPERETDFCFDRKVNLYDKIKKSYTDVHCILVDEAQFFSHEQIVDFWKLAHIFDIGVICYGLKNDFQGFLFEGTSALLSYADSKTELTVKCECGETAIFNARCIGGKYTIKGDTVAIDGEEDVSYIPLCGDCYLHKVIGKSKVSDRLKD